jgi:hypothetical protein
MVVCPRCGTAMQTGWAWCDACGWAPDAGRPAPPPSPHPAVLRAELVPRADDRSASTSTTRPRAAGGAGGYVPKPDRTLAIVGAVGGIAVVVVLLAVVLLRGGDPVPVTTADRSSATFTTTTALTATAWTLPEGGFKVDLPTTLEPAPAPEVPAPFVSGAAYRGAVDGREYLVVSLAVHPAYKWEDIGRAMIDAEDGLGAQHGFAVVSRSAGAFKEMSSSRFTFVAARGPTETEAEFATRKEGPPTGEGIALVRGNHLYVVLVKGESLPHAHFEPVLESIVVV